MCMLGEEGGGMICCMSGLSPSSVTKHTRTSLCHLCVGVYTVCLCVVCFYYKPTRPVQDQTNTQKPKSSPFLRQGPLVVFGLLVYHLVSVVVTVNLQTRRGSCASWLLLSLSSRFFKIVDLTCLGGLLDIKNILKQHSSWDDNYLEYMSWWPWHSRVVS